MTNNVKHNCNFSASNNTSENIVINVLLKSKVTCPKYTGLFILISVFPVSATNNYFEIGYAL